jgi:hypothetical protein
MQYLFGRAQKPLPYGRVFGLGKTAHSLQGVMAAFGSSGGAVPWSLLQQRHAQGMQQPETRAPLPPLIHLVCAPIPLLRLMQNNTQLRRPSPIQGIACIDTEAADGAGAGESVWMAGPQELVGAIAHAPAAGSGGGGGGGGASEAGYIIGVITNGAQRSSEVVVLRTGDVATGPVCR